MLKSMMYKSSTTAIKKQFETYILNIKGRNCSIKNIFIRSDDIPPKKTKKECVSLWKKNAIYNIPAE